MTQSTEANNKEVKEKKAPAKMVVTVTPPKFGEAEFGISGNLLVVHRFSSKVKQELGLKQTIGSAAGNKKKREPKNSDDTFNEARYVSKEGWDGFNAAGIRCALISACRLVGLQMTRAKMSFFVVADGYDAKEPQIPLVRIYAEPEKQEDMARVETGQPYVTVRAAYHNWRARVRIRWDEGQHTLQDVTNLLARVGMQVGICEGRPDSKNSAGMGWGLFEIERTEDIKAA